MGNFGSNNINLHATVMACCHVVLLKCSTHLSASGTISRHVLFVFVIMYHFEYLLKKIFLYVLGLAGTLPEDLYFLIKKAVSVRKHLEKHRKVGFQISSPKLGELNIK